MTEGGAAEAEITARMKNPSETKESEAKGGARGAANGMKAGGAAHMSGGRSGGVL